MVFLRSASHEQEYFQARRIGNQRPRSRNSRKKAQKAQKKATLLFRFIPLPASGQPLKFVFISVHSWFNLTACHHLQADSIDCLVLT